VVEGEEPSLPIGFHPRIEDLQAHGTYWNSPLASAFAIDANEPRLKGDVGGEE
jgi:hypothetical protein